MGCQWSGSLGVPDIKKEKIMGKVQSMKNEENLVNNIMFMYILGVAVSGWGFVMLVLNGGVRECVFL